MFLVKKWSWYYIHLKKKEISLATLLQKIVSVHCEIHYGAAGTFSSKVAVQFLRRGRTVPCLQWRGGNGFVLAKRWGAWAFGRNFPFVSCLVFCYVFKVTSSFKILSSYSAPAYFVDELKCSATKVSDGFLLSFPSSKWSSYCRR